MYFQNYTALLGAFADTPRAELTLMLRIQDFCYDNMNFMKVFQKIILLLYKSKSFLCSYSLLALINFLRRHNFKMKICYCS